MESHILDFLEKASTQIYFNHIKLLFFSFWAFKVLHLNSVFANSSKTCGSLGYPDWSKTENTTNWTTKRILIIHKNFKFPLVVLPIITSGLSIAKSLTFIKSNYKHPLHHDTSEPREYDQVFSSFMLCNNSLFTL